jgi:hypothetical protein
MQDFSEIQIELGDHMPAGWLGPMFVAFGMGVFVALMVLLLVSGAHFADENSPALTKPGTCAPFCGAVPAPAPALIPPQQPGRS